MSSSPTTFSTVSDGYEDNTKNTLLPAMLLLKPSIVIDQLWSASHATLSSEGKRSSVQNQIVHRLWPKTASRLIPGTYPDDTTFACTEFEVVEAHRSNFTTV